MKFLDFFKRKKQPSATSLNDIKATNNALLKELETLEHIEKTRKQQNTQHSK